MGFFKRKTKREKLTKEYKKLLEEAYRLSHTDRKASDAKTEEAHQILAELESLED